jgi:hypothetical protein
MGEMEFEQKKLAKAVDSALQEAGELRVATPGGRFQDQGFCK